MIVFSFQVISANIISFKKMVLLLTEPLTEITIESNLI
jgi:hypothetical protein